MSRPHAVRRLVCALALVAPVACSGDTNGATTETSASSPAGGTTTTDDVEDRAFVDTVTFLAEQGDGRDNLSEGSRTVQARLVEELEAIAEPVPGGDGYLHPFAEGTNVLGMIEGTTAPSEVVVLGAHYDHLGRWCSHCGMRRKTTDSAR